MNYKISSIYFYPVKSISFQNLKKCVIKKDIGILNDRIFAISRLVDADKAIYIEKNPGNRKLNDLLNLKNTPELNKYKFEYEDGLLKLFFEDRLIQSANTNNPEEADLIIKELSQLENTIKGPNYLLKNEKFPFFDTTSSGEIINSISLINLETIKDFESKLGKKVEFQRFRGNFYIEGMPAWEEKKILGKTIEINGLKFKAEYDIPRCSATNLKPSTGEATINLPQKLKEFYNHFDLGIYLAPLEDGEISEGDIVKI